GRHRSKTNLRKTDLVAQVVEDAAHLQISGRQRHARPDRPAVMPAQQLPHAWSDEVVTSGPVAEDAEAVLQLLRAVDRDRDADPVVGEELDDVGAQQRGVGREAEVDLLALLRRAPPRVLERAPYHAEIEKRLASEEGEVNGAVGARLPEQELDGVARGPGVE